MVGYSKTHKNIGVHDNETFELELHCYSNRSFELICYTTRFYKCIFVSQFCFITTAFYPVKNKHNDCCNFDTTST